MIHNNQRIQRGEISQLLTRIAEALQEEEIERKSLLSAREVAEILSISTTSVRRMAKAGQLSEVRIGGSVRYKAEEVNRFKG